MRPRDIAGKTRRRIAAEELADLIAVETKMKKSTAELKALVKDRGSRLMELHGVGPVVAARTLADVGDIARFTDRNRFASWTGTAPLDASSGEQNRHRLSRAGNRRMNHMIHIAAISQIRLDTAGRAYYRRKLAAGKTQARSTALPEAQDLRRHLPPDARRRPTSTTHHRRRSTWNGPGRALRGVSRIQRGRPAPAHRHFGSATSRTRETDATTDPASPEDLPAHDTPDHRLTTKGSRSDAGGDRRLLVNQEVLRRRGNLSWRLPLSPLPLRCVLALVVQTDEPGGEPPLHGATDGRSTAPAIRVASALAIAWIVDPLKNFPCHATSLRSVGPLGQTGVDERLPATGRRSD